jgi:flagellar hook-associated protein 3 FlgL
METGKKIQQPSDDPIVAARALKFRTAYSETEQYMRNVQQGLSWMQVTEAGFRNAMEMLVGNGNDGGIRQLCVSASSSDKTYSDRQAIAENIRSFADQIKSEMNITFAGRYLFSGYRTDQPPVYEKDNTENYRITQQFKVTDIERTFCFQKLVSTEEPTIEDITLLKLAYKDAGTLSAQMVNYSGVPPAIAVTSTSSTVATAYDPPAANEVKYIQDTGELLIGTGVETYMEQGDLEITYQKQNFKAGELNPLAYFTCTDLNTGLNYVMDHEYEYEVGVNTRLNVNSLAKDALTDKMYADLTLLQDLLAKVTISDRDALIDSIMTANPTMTREDAATEADDQITRENQNVSNLLHDRFNNMIGLIDKHMAQMSNEHTDLGSRMTRMEMIENRLMQDRTIYEELRSNNEDVDMVELSVYMSNTKAVYDASLMAGAKIIQLTLANFI